MKVAVLSALVASAAAFAPASQVRARTMVVAAMETDSSQVVDI